MSPYIWLGLLVIVGGALMFIGDKLRSKGPETKIIKLRIDFVIFLIGMCSVFGGSMSIVGLLLKHFGS